MLTRPSCLSKERVSASSSHMDLFLIDVASTFSSSAKSDAQLFLGTE